jgi:ubiquinone/menaquinone biosynthesis C-methylase UbiE
MAGSLLYSARQHGGGAFVSGERMASSDVVVEAFTELASSYEKTVDRELRQYWGLSYEQFVQQLVRMVPVNEGDLVLDIATGTALIPLEISEKLGARGQAVGLDITPAMLQQAQKSIEVAGSPSNIRLICASALELPFLERTFDVVICGLGTHHMDVPKMLSEARRVLRRGGCLIMIDVGASAFWRSFWGRSLLKILLRIYKLSQRNSARSQAEEEAFENVRTADEWRMILSDLGFTHIEIEESRARHQWYPCALNIRATTRDTGETWSC